MAPINLPDGSQVSEIVLPDGSTASEVLAPDGSTVFSATTIPDSEAPQKLTHRWYYSASLIDVVGNSNATDSGTSPVSGSFVDGSARQGDAANNAYISLGTLSDWVADINDSGASVAFGLDLNNASSGDRLFGVEVTGEKIEIFYDGSGELGVNIGEPGTFARAISSGADLNDGNIHRVVVNMSNVNGLGTADVEFFVDGAGVAIGSGFDGINSPAANAQIVSHAVETGSGKSSHTDAIMDDVCTFGSFLSSSEASSYQPPY